MRDGWTETTFGGVFKIVAGKYVPKEEYIEDGKFWIYGSNSIMGKIDKYLVEQPHVIMAAIGAYAGAVRFSGEPSWINNNAMALVPNEEVLAKYLHIWLEFKFDLKRVVVGTGQPYVQRPLLLKERIELPPLPEQKRIVDLISSVDSYIATLEHQAESARKSRSAVLHEILSAGGVSWVESTLGEVTELVRGPFGGSLKKEIFVKDGFAVYEQQHAIYGDFSTIRYRISTEKFVEMKRFELLPGDLIMSCSGTMGKVRIVPDGADAGIINQALLKIKPKSCLTSEFLFLWMQSEDFIEQIEMNSGGGALQNVSSVKMLKGIKLPLPEISEQKRIVEIISSMNDGISATEKLISESKKLRSGLLSNLLSGDHEIPESYDKVIGAA